jgi:hypothetical protein
METRLGNPLVKSTLGQRAFRDSWLVMRCLKDLREKFQGPIMSYH